METLVEMDKLLLLFHWGIDWSMPTFFNTEHSQWLTMCLQLLVHLLYQETKRIEHEALQKDSLEQLMKFSGSYDLRTSGLVSRLEDTKAEISVLKEEKLLIKAGQFMLLMLINTLTFTCNIHFKSCSS